MSVERDVTRVLEAEQNALDGWRQGLIVSQRSGEPRALLANAIHTFRSHPEFEKLLRFNVLTQQVEAAKRTPWNFVGTWADEHDVLAAEWLQHAGVLVGAEIAGSAIQAVAREYSYHPVREWLRSLHWDCTPRLETWLSTYLGVDPSPYVSAVGRCALIGGVARALHPGCKVDTALILEGAQGLGKSQACQILGSPWYADQVGDPGSKDASMQIASVWLLEFAELESLGRADVGAIKAFMSRQSDHYRPPYARRVIDAPRSCWFIGTVNGSSYLVDETGGRRFWPVRCGQIDLEGLRRDRDQLLAEARVMCEAGAHWWLEGKDLNTAALEEQTARFSEDAWHDLIAGWVENRPHVTIPMILGQCLKKTEACWEERDMKRVGRVLRALRWERKRARIGNGGTLAYGYFPPNEGAQ